jgi:predicted permease
MVNVFRERRVRREWDEELRFHIEARTEDLVRDGLPRDAAAAEAARRLGPTLAARDASRDVRLLPWLDALLRDVRFGVRMLRKHAIVSTAAIVSLSLAIGACTAAFTLVDALILRPLPVDRPDQLFMLVSEYQDPGEPGAPTREYVSFSYPGFQQLRAAAGSRIALFAVSSTIVRPVTFADAPDDPQKLRAQWVSGNALPALGLRPALGRLLTPADDVQPGQHPVAVISHSLWTRRFGGAPSALGRWLTIDEKVTVQIVGVAPAGFTGVEPGLRTDIWLPQMMWADPRIFAQRDWNWFRVLGRLAPDTPVAPLQQELQAAFTTFRRESAVTTFGPDEPKENIARYVLAPLFLRPAPNGPSSLRKTIERPLWILGFVALLVLLIACSNVANLMLARAAARERELAVRVSLGAGRGRLVQQALVESALLAIVSSVAGLAIALAAAPALVSALAPADDPAYLDLRLDWRALAFVCGVGLLTSVLFGLAPAWRARGVAPGDVLKASGGGRHARGIRMFRPLIAAQIAFSGVVLFLACLFLLSFQRLASVDPGFTAKNLLLFSVKVDLPEGSARPAGIVDQLRQAVRALPGVEGASLSAWNHFSGGGWTTRVRIAGRPVDNVQVVHLAVSPGFVDTMRIGLLAGRDFDPRDSATPASEPRPGAPRGPNAATTTPATAATPAQPTAVIVNEAFAQRYFPGESPIGRHYRRPGNRTLVDQEIVGVMRNARYSSLRETPPPTVYVPLANFGGGSMQVRTALAPAEAIALVRQALPRVHPSLRVTEVTRQTMLIDNTMIRERLLALLSGFFAIVALVLAVVGLYGVLSYAVVQRTREIGIRLALGARRLRVVRVIVFDVALVALAGLAAGLGGGLLLARWVSTLLFEVRPSDLGSLAWPAACLAIAALLAGLPPAWRATRVDPLIALRWE